MLQTRIRRQTAEVNKAIPAASVPARETATAALTAGAAPTAPQMGRQVDLPGEIREKMEASFGADFSNVKLYESETVAQAGANAVAQGSNIAFAPGKLDFASTAGQALLGHELSHVVSQARGESAGSGFLNDPRLEAQADRQGMMAARGESVYSGPVSPVGTSSAAGASGPIQAQKDKTPRTKDGTDVSEFAGEEPLRIVRKTDSDAVKSKNTWRMLGKEAGRPERRKEILDTAAKLRKRKARGDFKTKPKSGDYEMKGFRLGVGNLLSSPAMKMVDGKRVVDEDSEVYWMQSLFDEMAQGREIMRSIASTGAPTPEQTPIPAPNPPAPTPAPAPAPKPAAPAPVPAVPAPAPAAPAPTVEAQPLAATKPAEEPVVKPAVEPAAIPAVKPADTQTGTAGDGEASGERKHSGRKRHSHSGEGGHTNEHSGRRKRHSRSGQESPAPEEQELTQEFTREPTPEEKKKQEELEKEFREIEDKDKQKEDQREISKYFAKNVLKDQLYIMDDNQKALEAEKKRVGRGENESLSGRSVYDEYLAAALPFREGGGGIGDAFVEGRQDPAAMAKHLRDDMKMINDLDYKSLYSEDDITVMNAHAKMLRYKMLGEGINKVIQYAQDNDQKELLKYLKPGGKVLPRFQRRQKRFEEAMGDAEMLRNTTARYYDAKDSMEEIKMKRKIDELREKRKANGKNKRK